MAPPSIPALLAMLTWLLVFAVDLGEVRTTLTILISLVVLPLEWLLAS